MTHAHYLDFIIEVAQFLAQFGVARLVFVVQTIFTPVMTGASMAAGRSAPTSSGFTQLWFHSRPAPLLYRPFRIPFQLDQLCACKKREKHNKFDA